MSAQAQSTAVGAPTDGGISETVEKLELDCLKLLEALESLNDQGQKQSLRRIGRAAGMSKDEVNRYLNPQVNELYTLDRLKHVRASNRPLYNHLIISGPPRVREGKWAGIEANTSKWDIFKAVAQKYGYEVEHLGERGHIVDLEYVGIEALSYQRQGIVFSFQEPVLYLDRYRPA